MNKSKKAVTLSAFVVPGAGQWYLGKRWQAVALMLASTIATYILLADVWEQANLIAQKMASGEIQLELSALMNVLVEHRSANSSNSMTMATVALGVIWLLGVGGAWISGKAADSRDANE